MQLAGLRGWKSRRVALRIQRRLTPTMSGARTQSFSGRSDLACGFLANHGFPRYYGEKLNEFFLLACKAHLLVLQHRLREQVELLSEVGIRFHPAAKSESPLHA